MEKKSFIVHYDKRAMLDMLIEKKTDGSLSYENFGRLFAALIDYAENGRTTVELDKATMIAFAAMTAQIDADIQRYAQRCEKNRVNGSKGGRPPKETEQISKEARETESGFQNTQETDPITEKAKKTDRFSEKAKKTDRFSEKAKKPDTDTDTVTDTDTDTVTDTVTDTDTVTETEKRDIISCTPSECSIPPLAGADPVVHSCGDERRHTSEETAVVKSSRKRGGGDKKYDAEIGQIIDYLNQKTGTKYKASTQATRRLIESRLKEGFTVEQFKSVIAKKVSDWSRDEKMAQFLRPETLFGSKFEGYLNSPAPVQRLCVHENEFDWEGIF